MCNNFAQEPGPVDLSRDKTFPERVFDEMSILQNAPRIGYGQALTQALKDPRQPGPSIGTSNAASEAHNAVERLQRQIAELHQQLAQLREQAEDLRMDATKAREKVRIAEDFAIQLVQRYTK